jgi:single-stranded-DNA-specific exonuclease
MIAELQKELFRKRGINTQKEIEEFLNPDFDKHIHDPFLLPDMKKACERVHEAIKNDELIVIYSDYDADGIPGGVIMADFFKKIGYKNFENYIPHRHDEGFGLNMDAVQSFIDKGVKVLITVDCGITDVEETNLATNSGIDVIITDHHIPHSEPPKAFAILNPKLSENKYPFDMLCGASIAWKFVTALIKTGDFNIVAGWEKWLLDMAGIATLSDMVPLTGENRVIAHYGLRVARKSRRPGLVTLLAKIKVSQNNLTEDDVGFMISPRINAASRMGHPIDAFNMLSADTEREALKYVSHLIAINDERKKLTLSLSKQIEIILKEKKIIPNVIVIGDASWKPGILGLVANNIAEKYKRPVFLWGRESGLLIKGSVRSGNLTDIVSLMKKVENLFEDYGGHAASGGFSISHEKVDSLEQSLNDVYENNLENKNENNDSNIDAYITIENIDKDLIAMLDKMAPFGLGNPKPIFCIQGVVVENIKDFGKGGTHLELVVSNKGKRVKCISFFKNSNHFPIIKEKRPIDIVCHIEKSYWNNKTEIRARIINIV